MNKEFKYSFLIKYLVEKLALREIGTVIASRNGPTVNHFSFVLKESNHNAIPIQKGQFVQLNSMGTLIAMVEDIIKTNRYFDHAEAVSEYERGGLPYPGRIADLHPVPR